MKRWKRLGGTLLLSTLLAATPLWAAGTEAAEKAKGHEVDLQLLSINDLHGQLNVTDTIDGKQVGGADVLATYLKERAADNKNTWMVHVGDAVGASAPVSALLQDEPTIEILNEIGFDLGTIGNHEFDEGVEEMLRLIHGGE